MGQLFDRQVAEPTTKQGRSLSFLRFDIRSIRLARLVTKISDLSQLPPELALQILKNLNATDLCLAACVWQTLANDEILWLGYPSERHRLSIEGLLLLDYANPIGLTLRSIDVHVTKAFPFERSTYSWTKERYASMPDK